MFTALHLNDDDIRPTNNSQLVHGLGIVLSRLPALLWVFLFNLLFSVLTAVGLVSAVGKITNNSLAAGGLSHGFDLGTLAYLLIRLAHGGALSLHTGPNAVLSFATFFIMLPGILFCYQTDTPARLSTIFQMGFAHFWRFVRITILAAIVMGLILGPLVAGYNRYNNYLDEHILGRPGFIFSLIGAFVVALIACALRLYFDLVEVYTVQIGLLTRPNGKPDRRVRRTLLPALRGLGHHLGSGYWVFLLLTALGLAGLGLCLRTAIHTLAQPRAWQIFLFTQAGLFLFQLSRFWQRAAETVLSQNHPILNREEAEDASEEDAASIVPRRAIFTPPPPAVSEPPKVEPRPEPRPESGSNPTPPASGWSHQDPELN